MNAKIVRRDSQTGLAEVSNAGTLNQDKENQPKSSGIAQVNPILLTVTEVSRLLGISVRSVWRLTSSGELPSPICLGRSKRWNRRSVESYVEQKLQAVMHRAHKK